MLKNILSTIKTSLMKGKGFSGGTGMKMVDSDTLIHTWYVQSNQHFETNLRGIEGLTHCGNLYRRLHSVFLRFPLTSPYFLT